MPEIMAHHLFRPVISCFSNGDSSDFKYLILISFRFARVRARRPEKRQLRRCAQTAFPLRYGPVSVTV
jgi:hypothetical protein